MQLNATKYNIFLFFIRKNVVYLLYVLHYAIMRLPFFMRIKKYNHDLKNDFQAFRQL